MKHSLVPKQVHNSLKSVLPNGLPFCQKNFCIVAEAAYNIFPKELLNCLSMVTSYGTPKWHTIFCQKNFCIVADVMLNNGFASTHLEKYSTATTAWV
jgi:hypothetical protein